MAKLTKLSKVNESITINRYDNGWMVEIGGRDNDNEWKTTKTMCNTEEEVLEVIKEWNSLDLDN
jgi:NTP pyrophosphatase (non-canonical NTP hydrolase)